MGGTIAVRGAPSSTAFDNDVVIRTATTCGQTMGVFSAWRRLDGESSGGSRLLPLQARGAIKHRAIAISEPGPRRS
jgi:hypothetical protein